MNGEERRKHILQILSKSRKPITGIALAGQFAVSRQVIVQDIALLRANGADIFSTKQGYLLHENPTVSRVFKTIHKDEEVEEELNIIVDLGGTCRDVFVYHKAYGVVRAEMNIRSRLDVRNFLKEITSGKSSLLKNVTSGYHYHTVSAESEEMLDLIQEELEKRGFLAALQDYEPVDFWNSGGEEQPDGEEKPGTDKWRIKV